MVVPASREAGTGKLLEPFKFEDSLDNKTKPCMKNE